MSKIMVSEEAGVRKTHFSYPSSCGTVDIAAICWEPLNVEPKAILQFVHGMIEFVDRYDEWARILCSNGYIVVGNDHIGHGSSINEEEEWGRIPMAGGNEYLIEDVHNLRLRAQEKFGSNLPYVLYGHSMGSFITRAYLTLYSNGLSAAVITGTGNQPAIATQTGKLLCKVIARFKGENYCSKLLNKMTLGPYALSVKDAKTPTDWLTRDDNVVAQYRADPRCRIHFAVNAYYALYSLVHEVSCMSSVEKIPIDLPLLIASGECDAVGSNGKAVKKFYSMCVKHGMKKVEIRLYKDARHELHNELEKETFYSDTLAWLDAHI